MKNGGLNSLGLGRRLRGNRAHGQRRSPCALELSTPAGGVDPAIV